MISLFKSPRVVLGGWIHFLAFDLMVGLYIVTDALCASQLYLVQDPAHRLQREDVVPQVRYRVTTEGWERVAERGRIYEY